MRGILATAVGLVMALALLLGAPPSDVSVGSDDGTLAWQQATLILETGWVADVIDMTRAEVQVPLKTGLKANIVRTNFVVHTINKRAMEVAPTPLKLVGYQFPYNESKLAA